MVNLLSQTVLTSRANSQPQSRTIAVSANRIASDLPSIINKNAGLLHQNDTAVDVPTVTKIPDSPFLSNTIPVINSDGTYTVDGVSFTKREFVQCRSIMQLAIAGIETNGTVDYINYAQMSIANHAMQSFASQNLNKEQATVLARAMKNYTEGLLKAEGELLSANGYVTSNAEEISVYYGKQKFYSDDEVKAINDLIDEMNRVSGGNKAHVGSDFTTTVTSATNQSVIKSIFDLFSSTDFSHSVAVEQAMEKYKSIMTPVYLASGIHNEHGALMRVLNGNVSKLSDFIRRITLDSKYACLNISI